MDRLSSAQTCLLRQNLPDVETSVTSPSLPEELVREIIDKIDKADNQTLTNLVQSCKDMARIAGTDALLSFFYAARSAYDTGDTDKKVNVFIHLVDWIQGPANQLPDECVYQLIENLSEMSEIDVTNDTQRVRLVAHIRVLLEICIKNNQSPLIAVRRAFAENSDATVTLLVASQRLIRQVSLIHTAIAASMNAAY